jgi:dihydroorotate dehydrogenase (NAD+) catalytic subunit
MKNPLILASGVLGVNKNNLLRAEHGGAGALTIKSISLEPREGHKNPITAVFECGMLNAVGYSNPGLKEAMKEFSDLSEFKVPVIGSITAGNAEEFASLAKEFEKLSFNALELPLSCPHTPGFGLLAGQGTPEATKAITEAVRKETKKPLIVKVSPSIPNIGAWNDYRHQFWKACAAFQGRGYVRPSNKANHCALRFRFVRSRKDSDNRPWRSDEWKGCD